MPTNLALDDKLISQAVRCGKHKTKKEAVNAALREYVACRRREGLIDLFGLVEYAPSYDYKALRRGKRR